jgi:hypothetical protein
MSGAELEVYEAHSPATLFGSDDPAEVVARATAAARPLAEVVNRQRLFATIGGKKHTLVEGWTLLGSMLGVFPVTVWTRRIEATPETAEGWEARVEARTRAGDVVGAAEAMCTRDERTWKGRDEYALRSMAQTRATSKALRQPLGFVMVLAGYSGTPAEEMPRGEVIEDGELADTPFSPSAFEPPAGATEERPKGTVSEAQRKNIYRLLKKLVETGEWSEETLKGELFLAYGVKSTTELTKAEASSVIDGWKKRAGEETP